MGRLAILAISFLVGGSHALTSHKLQKEHDSVEDTTGANKADLHKKAHHLHERKLTAHERKLRIRANQAMHFQKKKHEYEEAHQGNTQTASAEDNQAKQTKKENKHLGGANGQTQQHVVQAALPSSSTPKLQLSVKELAKEINGMTGSMENKPITTPATEALTPALNGWNTFIDKGVQSGVEELNTFIDKAIDRIPENKVNFHQEEQGKAAAMQKKIDTMPANPQLELLKMIFNPKVPSPYGLGIIRDFSHDVPKDVSFFFSHDDYRIHPKRGEVAKSGP